MIHFTISSAFPVEPAVHTGHLRALLTVTPGQRHVQDCPRQTMAGHMYIAISKQLFLKPK